MTESNDIGENWDTHGTVDFTSRVIQSIKSSFDVMLDESKWYVTLNAGAMAGIIALQVRWPAWAMIAALVALSISMFFWFKFRLKLIRGKEELITNALTLTEYVDPSDVEHAAKVREGIVKSRSDLVNITHGDYLLAFYIFVVVYLVAGIVLVVGAAFSPVPIPAP